MACTQKELDAEMIGLVQSSWKKVEPIAEAAAELFYDRLFEMDPELRPLFKSDMKDQGKKLMQMITVAVNGLAKLDEIVPAVQALGRRHKDYDVLDAHYDTVGAALLWTLEKALGAALTAKTKEAWVITYDTLATAMKASGSSRASEASPVQISSRSTRLSGTR